MKVQYIIIAILFSIGPGILSAQPDEAYIKGLTGEIENAWLESVGKSMPVQQLDWDVKTVPGFKKTSDLSRQQALLSQSWNFFPIDLNKGISTGIDVKLPHSFEKERNYKSGWYFIKFSFEKKPNEKYILLLDRVEMFSMVFLNGTRCGHHFGAYTPFETDLSDELVSGENVLAIYVHDISATEDGDKLYNQIGNRGKR